jgi:predicted TIM-barrel fold metal-dependent hydrolase
LDALWDAFGDDRVIYGSNWPVCERAGTFEQRQLPRAPRFRKGTDEVLWKVLPSHV